MRREVLAAAAGEGEGDAGKGCCGSAGEEAGHHGGESGCGEVGSGVLGGVGEDGLVGEEADSDEDGEQEQGVEG